MKKDVLFVVFCVFVCVCVESAYAGPRPGTWFSDVDFPPGVWREILWNCEEGVPGNMLEADSKGCYAFYGAVLETVELVSQGEFMSVYRTRYDGGELVLVNEAQNPWYSESDAADSFVFELGETFVETSKGTNGRDSFVLHSSGELSGFPGVRVTLQANTYPVEPVWTLSGDGSCTISGGLAWAQVTITAPPPPPMVMDIKPGSCENPVNVKSRGVLPVAVLGSSALDILEVDPASARMLGVSPLRWSYEDVGTATDSSGEESIYDCERPLPDGLDDLVIKFDWQEILAVLESQQELNDGDILFLTLTADLLEGKGSIEASDLVTILKRGKDKQDKR